MFDLGEIFLFLGASVLLTVTPGPDNVFVVAQGIARGRRAAVVTAWGMCCGISVHTLAAAGGIAALFHALPIAFHAVKWAGAGYLLYLAYRAVRESAVFSTETATVTVSVGAFFRRGFIMNVLNPKVALFFVAFLPQFTSAETGPVELQVIVLGLLFMAQGLIIFTAIGLFSGTVGSYLIRRPRVNRLFAWLSAAIFAALGARLALAQP